MSSRFSTPAFRPRQSKRPIPRRRRRPPFKRYCPPVFRAARPARSCSRHARGCARPVPGEALEPVVPIRRSLGEHGVDGEIRPGAAKWSKASPEKSAIALRPTALAPACPRPEDGAEGQCRSWANAGAPPGKTRRDLVCHLQAVVAPPSAPEHHDDRHQQAQEETQHQRRRQAR